MAKTKKKNSVKAISKNGKTSGAKGPKSLKTSKSTSKSTPKLTAAKTTTKAAKSSAASKAAKPKKEVAVSGKPFSKVIKAVSKVLSKATSSASPKAPAKNKVKLGQADDKKLANAKVSGGKLAKGEEELKKTAKLKIIAKTLQKLWQCFPIF